MDTSKAVRRQPTKSTGSLHPPTSRPGSASASSKQDVSGGESESGEPPTSPGEGDVKQNIKRRLSSSSKKSQKSGVIDTTHDAMGSKWPKAMWDNTESKFQIYFELETYRKVKDNIIIVYIIAFDYYLSSISRLLANDNGHRNVCRYACKLYKTT